MAELNPTTGPAEMAPLTMAHHAPNPSFNGLNDAQVSAIFGQIACTANLVANLCREHANTVGNSVFKTTFQALDAMVSSLGAMADMPAHLANTGSFAQWIQMPPRDSEKIARHGGDHTPQTRFNDLSEAQLSLLLRNIATSVNLLVETCRESIANAGRTPVALHLAAIHDLLSNIGALADMALCSPVNGDFAAWAVGQFFHGEAGAETAAHPLQ